MNSISDRRLVEHRALRLDVLYLLGYEVDEDLPWHSAISRTRQLYPTAVFECLFDHVFARCVARGLVKGERRAVGSTPIKANASPDSLREKQPLAAFTPLLTVAGQPLVTPAPHPAAVLSAPAHQLRREAARQAKCQPGSLGARYAQAAG